jgi:thioredoxin reductase
MQHSCNFIFYPFAKNSYMIQKQYDVAIIGGSYSGLAAALTMGRSKRRAIVFDTGKPRNEATANAYNFSGNDGTPPATIRALSIRDVQKYPDIKLLKQKVVTVTNSGPGFELTTETGKVYRTRKMILATGVTDRLPAINGFENLWGRKIFHCAYCHGWEIKDIPAIIIAKGTIAWEMAITTSNWNSQLTFLLNGTTVEDTDKRNRLMQKGYQLIETPVTSLIDEATQVRILLSNGTQLISNAVYAKPAKVLYNNELAVQLGCALEKCGSVVVDNGMQTSVAGVFAVGDLSHPGYHQVSEAISTGHKAAVFCNNQLNREDFMI